MKHLKIKDNKSYFSLNGQDWILLDQINKDHMLALMDLALGDNFEMDPFIKENLANQAHQIIYKKLYEKFSSLISNKQTFRTESESMFKEAFEKYSAASQS